MITEFKECETKFYDTILNEYLDFTEIVCYKKEFQVTTGNITDIDEETGVLTLKNNSNRERKFEEVDGLLVQKCDSLLIENLSRTIKNSRKRAIDNLFAYVLSNRWKYWLTITFSPKFVNREVDDEIKEKYHSFQQTLTYYFSDVEYLAVPERHPRSGCLHFHILLNNCDLTNFMSVAKGRKNQVLKSFGKTIYNLNLFKFGYSTIVECDSNNLIIANYMAKYMIKDFGNIGYNKKNFYHSRNLVYKNKELYNCGEFNKEPIIQNLLDSPFCEKYKETDKLVVYRVKLPF